MQAYDRTRTLFSTSL